MTITQDTSLNAAFAAERTAQIGAMVSGRQDAVSRQAEYAAQTQARIDAGKLVPLGNGSYRVDDPGSWDNGEVWTMRQPRGLDQPLILPVSNLDESRGSAALYTTVPEWHGLGNVVPEGVTDLSEVLRLGGIDYEVRKVPALYRRPRFTDKDGFKVPSSVQPVPGGFVNVRVDTGAALGQVGSIYTNIQTLDAGLFLQDLVDKYDVTFASAGALNGGRKVFIGLKLPDSVILDLGDGVTDEITQYLYWLNSFDGSTSATAILTPWRIACGNTERFGLRDAVARWRTRHTTNALSEENVKEARRTLGLSLKYAKSFKAEEEALARNELLIAEFEQLADQVFPLDSGATDRQKRAADERKGTLIGTFVQESDKLGLTGYAAERAITNYLDYRPRRGPEDNAVARATAVIEGADDERKTRAHQLLMNRVK